MKTINDIKLFKVTAMIIVMVLCFYNVNFDINYTASAESANLTKIADEVINCTNNERKKAGLSQLEKYDKLMSDAKIRAKEISGQFSHQRPDGSMCYSAYGNVSYRMIGENIAYNYVSSPKKVVEMWMNSPMHKENILTKDFNYIGVGVYQYRGYYYFVQVFACCKKEVSVSQHIDSGTLKINKSAADLNGDGKINSEDATFILVDYAKKLVNPSYMGYTLSQADANEDGKINSEDATIILIYYAYSLVGKV